VQRQLWTDLLPKSAVRVRPGSRADLDQVEKIQASSHIAGPGEPDSYMQYDLQVAEVAEQIAGFSVSRTIDAGEVEVLNIAVCPSFRRRGIATRLLRSIRANHLILEVRESNLAARTLYEKLGFREIGRRDKYYDDPEETAIVMRLSR
jgi:ribosomal-protein-alanine acetyltransferase